MVRTKADGGARKAVAAKAPRKSMGSGGGVGPASSAAIPNAIGKSKYAGGNVVFPRPTPEWQKGIMNFLIQSPMKKDRENDSLGDDDGAGSSKRLLQARTDESKVEKKYDGNKKQLEEKEIKEDEGEEKDTTHLHESSRSDFQKNHCIEDSDDEIDEFKN